MHFAKIRLPATAGNNSLQGKPDYIMQLEQISGISSHPFQPDFFTQNCIGDCLERNPCRSNISNRI